MMAADPVAEPGWAIKTLVGIATTLSGWGLIRSVTHGEVLRGQKVRMDGFETAQAQDRIALKERHDALIGRMEERDKRADERHEAVLVAIRDMRTDFATMSKAMLKSQGGDEP